MHTDSHFIVGAILSFCCLLLVLSVTKHYAKNSLIPADAWVLIIGLIYGLWLKHLELDKPPTFSLNPDVIILVLLPLLIFSSGRLIDVKDLKPQALPIGFFARQVLLPQRFLLEYRYHMYWAFQLFMVYYSVQRQALPTLLPSPLYFTTLRLTNFRDNN
jgi:uncharacterized membrane protein YczE